MKTIKKLWTKQVPTIGQAVLDVPNPSGRLLVVTHVTFFRLLLMMFFLLAYTASMFASGCLAIGFHTQKHTVTTNWPQRYSRPKRPKLAASDAYRSPVSAPHPDWPILMDKFNNPLGLYPRQQVSNFSMIGLNHRVVSSIFCASVCHVRRNAELLFQIMDPLAVYQLYRRTQCGTVLSMDP